MTRRSYNTLMPRTRRYIFNTLTVVSLMLLLATVGLWVEVWNLNTTVFGEEHKVFCEGHSVCILIIPEEQLFFYYEYQYSIEEFGSVHADVNILGFAYRSWTENGVELMSFGLPLYLFVVVFSIAPTIWLFKWRKRRKLGPNACLACGYDLTGNESGVCPECGVGVECAG